ncbi:uncharacterized protein LOC144132405 isoform X5 [Amblyomma americanum]
MAPVVLVAKVLPRCFASTDAEASLRLLNRKLTAALKRMPCVGILNPDHRLLDAMKAPKRHLFATDGHHLSAGEAIEELAEVFVRGLAKFYGAGILAPFSGAPARNHTAWLHSQYAGRRTVTAETALSGTSDVVWLRVSVCGLIIFHFSFMS